MSDVARAANVSRSTVSVVLSGRREGTAQIAPETRERVLKVAQDLGYRRNALARAVKTGRSFTLGFLSVGWWTEYQTLWLLAALDTAEANGYTIKRFCFHNTPEDAKTMERCLEQQLDGLIVTGDEGNLMAQKVTREFATYNIPIVWIFPQKPMEKGVWLFPEEEEGCAAAVHHLAELGHRTIMFLGGSEEMGTSVPRFAGFERGVQETGVRGYVRWTNWLLEPSYLEETMALPVPPTAFICQSDALAIYLLQYLWRNGRRVPEDISVIGYGDLERTRQTTPPLTTVRVPYSEMGTLAVERLLAFLDSQSESSRWEEELRFPAPLIVRESTSAPVRTALGLVTKTR